MQQIVQYIDNSISDETAILLFAFTTWASIFLFGMVGICVSFVVKAIPVYIMADKAGYSHPFLAFVPFGQSYIMHILPIKEYSFLGMFKTYERKKAYLAYILITYVAWMAIGIVSMAFGFIPILSYLVGLLLFAVEALLSVAKYIVKAIMYIDLFDTYGNEDGTLPKLFGILGLFVPLLHIIGLYIYCTKEPSFGFGNFYSPIVETEE